jgi:hypothetical protein
VDANAPVVLAKELPPPTAKNIDTHTDGTSDAVWRVSTTLTIARVADQLAIFIEGRRKTMIPCDAIEARRLALALLAASLHEGN